MRRLFILTALAGALAAAAASAGTVFEAVLNGPNAGTASTATGFGTVILSDDQTELEYYIEFTGLEGVESAAHFHNGAPGLFGSRLLTLPAGSPKTGVWQLNAFALQEILAGRLYVNIHTDLYVTGEIRGDFLTGVVAREPTGWDGVKALYR